MPKDNIQISVVIPAYNAERYIGRAIRSVLLQTYPVYEILVVDDGSTDGTTETAGRFGPPVKVLRQENRGVSAARNAGIRAAAGEWIAFLDADDEWLPERLERQTGLLRACPDLVWVMGNYYECLCEEGRLAEHTVAGVIRNLTDGRGCFESYFRAFRHYLWGHMNVLLVRRDTLRETGLFADGMKVGEDLDLWLRIAYRHPKVGFCAEPLAVYHLGIAQNSMRPYRGEADYAAFVERHRKLAAENKRTEVFRPCAEVMMKRWIRSLLFDRRTEEIREMIRRNRRMIGPVYRGWISVLICFPRMTAGILHGISRLVRFLKLRRKVVRRPPGRALG